MSAFGPKQTWARALHMSAFEGKADMTVCGSPLSRSLLGVKRTCRFAHRPPLALVGQLKDNERANFVIADCRKLRASPLNKILFQQFAVVLDAPKKGPRGGVVSNH